MSSSAKTQYLLLNKWAGSDTPKRIDFNSDNEIIDTALGEHIMNEALHVTQADKNAWNEKGFICGSYFGTNEVHRQFAVGFQPKAVFLIANGYPPTGFDPSGNKVISYSGIAINGSGSLGLSVTEDGFAVDMTQTLGNAVSYLNKSAITYIYIAFR